MIVIKMLDGVTIKNGKVAFREYSELELEDDDACGWYNVLHDEEERSGKLKPEVAEAEKHMSLSEKLNAIVNRMFNSKLESKELTFARHRHDVGTEIINSDSEEIGDEGYSMIYSRVIDKSVFDKEGTDKRNEETMQAIKSRVRVELTGHRSEADAVIAIEVDHASISDYAQEEGISYDAAAKRHKRGMDRIRKNADSCPKTPDSKSISCGEKSPHRKGGSNE